MKTDEVTFLSNFCKICATFFQHLVTLLTEYLVVGGWVSRVSIRALIDKKEKFAPKVILTFLLSIAHINP